MGEQRGLNCSFIDPFGVFILKGSGHGSVLSCKNMGIYFQFSLNEIDAMYELP